MGAITSPLPVKPIIAVLTAEPPLLSSVYQVLSHRLGAIDWTSALLPFSSTTYYAAEMGENLQRQFLSFKRLMDAGELAAMKRFTNEVEREFAPTIDRNGTQPRLRQRHRKSPKFAPTIDRNGTQHRRVNLDAGYVCSAKLVLASTKDHAHRIYLRDGIYAEITLRFHRKTFRPWDWTYPDYRSPAYIDIFNYIRTIYREQLNSI